MITISKAQDRLYEQLMAQLQSQIAKANEPSPIEVQRQQDYASRQNFLNSKDFRNTSGVTGLTQMSLPEYLKQHNQLTGVSKSIPGVDNNITNNQKALTGDQFNQDYGSTFQDQVNGLQQMQTGGATQGVNDFNSRMGMGMQGLQGQMNGVLNRPAGFDWLSLLGAGVGAASGLAGSFGGGGGQMPQAPVHEMGHGQSFNGHGWS